MDVDRTQQPAEDIFENIFSGARGGHRTKVASQRLRLNREELAVRYAGGHSTISSYHEFVSPFVVKYGALEQAKNLLSIGPGQSLLEKELLEQYNLRYGYVEPSLTHVQSFQEWTTELAQQHRLSDAHNEPLKTFETDHQYDLILAVQSVFAVCRTEDELRKVLSMLSSSGRLLLICSSNEDSFHQFRRLRKTSEDYSDWFSSLGISHQCEPVKYSISLREKSSTIQKSDWIDYFEFIQGKSLEHFDCQEQAMSEKLMRKFYEQGFVDRSLSLMVLES